MKDLHVITIGLRVDQEFRSSFIRRHLYSCGCFHNARLRLSGDGYEPIKSTWYTVWRSLMVFHDSFKRFFSNVKRQQLSQNPFFPNHFCKSFFFHLLLFSKSNRIAKEKRQLSFLDFFLFLFYDIRRGRSSSAHPPITGVNNQNSELLPSHLSAMRTCCHWVGGAGQYPKIGTWKKKNEIQFFSVKDMHCLQVLTFLWSSIEWLSFCQNLWTCYYFLQRKTEFPFFWNSLFSGIARGRTQPPNWTARPNNSGERWKTFSLTLADWPVTKIEQLETK